MCVFVCCRFVVVSRNSRIDAALGGDAEKTGVVKVDKLRAICKKFELTIDIDQLVREIDTDNSGNIEYEEFKAMLQ